MFNLRKKMTTIWQDYIKRKYSDVDTDKVWEKANKFWNNSQIKVDIRSSYNKDSEFACGIGVGFIFLFDEKYNYMFKHLFEDKVKKDF